jgi:nucleotide-binding universal stress UspA family protein
MRQTGEWAMKIYDPKKVLVPIDFSELSLGVLQAAAEIGENRNAEVHVLHVAKESNYIPTYGDDFAGGRITLSQLKEDSRVALESQLEDLVKEVSTRVKVKSSIVWGDPVKEIIQISESNDIDLIVMATNGRKGLSRFFIGSVTEEVIRRAPCPLFVVRAKVAQELIGETEIQQAAMN